MSNLLMALRGVSVATIFSRSSLFISLHLVVDVSFSTYVSVSLFILPPCSSLYLFPILHSCSCALSKLLYRIQQLSLSSLFSLSFSLFLFLLSSLFADLHTSSSRSFLQSLSTSTLMQLSCYSSSQIDPIISRRIIAILIKTGNRSNGKSKKRSKSLLTISTRFANFSDQYVIFCCR